MQRVMRAIVRGVVEERSEDCDGTREPGAAERGVVSEAFDRGLNRPADPMPERSESEHHSHLRRDPAQPRFRAARFLRSRLGRHAITS
jgi:hypothetical protein